MPKRSFFIPISSPCLRRSSLSIIYLAPIDSNWWWITFSNLSANFKRLSGGWLREKKPTILCMLLPAFVVDDRLLGFKTPQDDRRKLYKRERPPKLYDWPTFASKPSASLPTILIGRFEARLCGKLKMITHKLQFVNKKFSNF